MISEVDMYTRFFYFVGGYSTHMAMVIYVTRCRKLVFDEFIAFICVDFFSNFTMEIAIMVSLSNNCTCVSLSLICLSFPVTLSLSFFNLIMLIGRSGVTSRTKARP